MIDEFPLSHACPQFPISLSVFSIEVFEVVLYHYSHKPATDKEEPYTEILPTIHTTGEFHGSHTGSILPSQYQKTIVRKLMYLKF